jgi:Alpha-glutamyl/putrescinyl thymine pyrophosphorylase clade 2
MLVSDIGNHTKKLLMQSNRREQFIRWYAWSMQFGDCDPAVWMTNYLHQRYEHNDEERLWLAWLYGNTYQLPTAWVLKNEFPDYELATVSRITWWNTHNYKRLRYQTDTKWNKGHLPVMFESYQKFIGKKPQREVLESYYGDTEEQSFDNLWTSIKSRLHKFGRYSTWFYLQHLKHTAGIRIDPTSLMLNDFDGSRSHRNGLLLALGQDDKYDVKLTAGDYARLEQEAKSILEEIRNRFPNIAHNCDFFTMETCLCSFKKIFRAHHGRYLGYYLDRQSEEVMQAEGDGWAGIDWDVLWQARNETLDQRLVGRNKINKEKFTSYINSGRIEKLEWMFDDEQPVKQGLEAIW